MSSRYVTCLWLAVVVCWCMLALETKVGQGRGHALPHHHTPAENDAFEGYKNVHRKKYKSQEDHDHRKKKFVHNHRKIQAHNAKHAKGEVKFKLAHNEYSDLNTTEFLAKLTGFRPPSSAARRAYEASHPASLRAATNLPVSVDWRSKGYVTSVKNQGLCGSCFTFSALGALEGAVYKKAGRLTALSEQMLVDCMYPPRGGCSGGWMHEVWDFINTKNGIPTDKTYPYTAEVSSCKTKTQQSISKITTHYVTSDSEEALQEALATVGPISVAVDAGSEAFQLYHSGVYFEDICSANSINHAVLAVGYGVDEWSGFETWIIKNSWGTTWGEDGYMYLARNMDNMCGVARYAVYPTLA